jgi:hypothetical protein
MDRQNLSAELRMKLIRPELLSPKGTMIVLDNNNEVIIAKNYYKKKHCMVIQDSYGQKHLKYTITAYAPTKGTINEKA